MRAIFVFTPNEAKRLIAKAVVKMPEVKHAFQKTNLLIGHGSTNIYLLEELLGKEKFHKLMNPSTYLSGITIKGILCTTDKDEKPPIILIKKGIITSPPGTMSEMMNDFKADSVVIKGASAIDAEGNAAVMVSHPEGGTIGWSISTIVARGICLIVPVGLEKMVPSVKQAVAAGGQERLDYAQGKKVGMIPMPTAKLVTEIEALKILTGVDAWHVASGGINGSEGAVSIVAEGTPEAMDKTITLCESVKGEPPINILKGICETCVDTSPVKSKGFDFRGVHKSCHFEGKKLEELPPYMQQR
ncbi:hypothetical protein ACFLTW_05440 [Chloroflexota bacterium]